MGRRLRRLREFVARYRVDRRLPPQVLAIYTEAARLRRREITDRLAGALLPVTGTPIGPSSTVARLGGRRYAVAGPLDTSTAALGHRHARAVVAAFAAAGVPCFVVDRHGDGLVVGVEESERRVALDALVVLGTESAAWYVAWHDRGTEGTVALGEAGRHPRVRVARRWSVFRLHDEGGRAVGRAEATEITFWTPGTSGQLELVGTRGQERFDARSPTTVETIDGHHYPSRAAFPIGADLRYVDVPIDLVYTWVDGDDLEWRETMRSWAERTGRPVDDPALDPARFRSRDELRYSLRSVWRNCGWARHIYVVTAGQRPAWLGDHERITVVDHRSILPAEALPTFNSHAIETALHHIDGLAEHFVYCNDDIFVGRPVRPELFFTPNGLARVFQSGARVPGFEDDSTQHVDTAARRGRTLLEQRFGRVVTHKPLHTAFPLRVSVLEEVEREFAEAVGQTARSRFRSRTDLSVASSFAQHYGLATGRAVLGEIDVDYVHVESRRLHTHLERLRLGRDRDVFCINETADAGEATVRADAEVRAFLADYFPVAAPWETDQPHHP